MFRNRGTAKGDAVYIITVKQGQLLLLTRLTVGNVCGIEGAARLLGRDPEGLWEAEDHIVAEFPAPIRPAFEEPIPLAITQQLRFEIICEAKHCASLRREYWINRLFAACANLITRQLNFLIRYYPRIRKQYPLVSRTFALDCWTQPLAMASSTSA
jgi:hypothetical protein